MTWGAPRGIVSILPLRRCLTRDPDPLTPCPKSHHFLSNSLIMVPFSVSSLISCCAFGFAWTCEPPGALPAAWFTAFQCGASLLRLSPEDLVGSGSLCEPRTEGTGLVSNPPGRGPRRLSSNSPAATARGLIGVNRGGPSCPSRAVISFGTSSRPSLASPRLTLGVGPSSSKLSWSDTIPPHFNLFFNGPPPVRSEKNSVWFPLHQLHTCTNFCRVLPF